MSNPYDPEMIEAANYWADTLNTMARHNRVRNCDVIAVAPKFKNDPRICENGKWKFSPEGSALRILYAEATAVRYG
jgi:hypothetical protein